MEQDLLRVGRGQRRAARHPHRPRPDHRQGQYPSYLYHMDGNLWHHLKPKVPLQLSGCYGSIAETCFAAALEGHYIRALELLPGAGTNVWYKLSYTRKILRECILLCSRREEMARTFNETSEPNPRVELKSSARWRLRPLLCTVLRFIYPPQDLHPPPSPSLCDSLPFPPPVHTDITTPGVAMGGRRRKRQQRLLRCRLRR